MYSISMPNCVPQSPTWFRPRLHQYHQSSDCQSLADFSQIYDHRMASIASHIWGVYVVSNSWSQRLNVSKLREKSYGSKATLRTQSAAVYSFSRLVIGVPVCAKLACWQLSANPRFHLVPVKIMVPYKMGQIPAVSTGLVVGTNPPSLPTEDQRWAKTMRDVPLRT